MISQDSVKDKKSVIFPDSMKSVTSPVKRLFGNPELGRPTRYGGFRRFEGTGPGGTHPVDKKSKLTYLVAFGAYHGFLRDFAGFGERRKICDISGFCEICDFAGKMAVWEPRARKSCVNRGFRRFEGTGPGATHPAGKKTKLTYLLAFSAYR